MKTQGWGRIITVGSVQEAKPHPEFSSILSGFIVLDKIEKTTFGTLLILLVHDVIETITFLLLNIIISQID